jgi:hypothetical protein
LQQQRSIKALACAFSPGNQSEVARRKRSGVFNNKEPDMITTDQIRQNMEVVGNDGLHVGVIERVEAGEIKLTGKDSPDGLQHFLPLANVEYVDDRVRLNRSSTRAMAEWR